MVAILDTGVADHRWFDFDGWQSIVERFVYDPVRATVAPAGPDDGGGETQPNLIDPLEGLIDPYFGHGTFIAGLMRQNCPDADLLSIKLMGNDGIVDGSRVAPRLDRPARPTRSRPCAG